MPSQKFETLIVGQGLAGSLLAFRLIRAGQNVLVIDNDLHRSATRVAAGIINPITGHRWNLTDRFFDYLPVAKTVYTELGEALAYDFMQPTEQIRLVKNAGQADYMQRRLRESGYASIITPLETQQIQNQGFGCANISQTYRVDAQQLLKRIQQWLLAQDSLIKEPFDYDSLAATNQAGFTYKTYAFNSIVFCEGIQAQANPWLSTLPFKPAKGSILDIQLHAPLKPMLNWGQWILPTDGGYAKLGSTYEWNELSDIVLERSQQQLIDNSKKFTNIEFSVVNHRVGIRPSTRQRSPFVGELSSLNNAFCLNGLGSKGCLLAPYYVEQLAQLMIRKKPVATELSQWL